LLRLTKHFSAALTHSLCWAITSLYLFIFFLCIILFNKPFATLALQIHVDLQYARQIVDFQLSVHDTKAPLYLATRGCDKETHLKRIHRRRLPQPLSSVHTHSSHQDAFLAADTRWRTRRLGCGAGTSHGRPLCCGHLPQTPGRHWSNSFILCCRYILVF